MDAAVTPPGWPAAIPAPGADEFEVRAIGWLLDHGPPGLRAEPVMRQHPVVLAHVVVTHVAGEIASLRAAYASTRRDLADAVSADVVSAALAAIERCAAETTARHREATLLGEALRGRRWTPRL